MVKIIIDPTDPWAGLIAPDTQVVGLLQMKGAPMGNSGGGGGLLMQDQTNGQWDTWTDEEFRRDVARSNAKADRLKAGTTDHP